MLKEILRDFLLLYKNFFHWNVSKILIYIGAALFAVLLASPFFIIAISIGYSDPVNWQEIFGYYSQTGRLPITFLETIEVHGWNVLLNSSLILLGFFMLFIGWTQYLLTSAKLYLGYIDGERIPFLGNIYFNIKIYGKYFFYRLWLILVLIIPILLFIVVIAGVFFLLGLEYIDQHDQLFVGIVGVTLFVCFMLFLYFSFRYGYGYLVLADTKNYPELQRGRFYLKESAKLTQGNMLKILWITLLFSVIIFLPIEIVSTIISEVIKNDVISIVWGILAFLLFSLSYEMLFTSMYRRILLKNNQKEISEEKQEIV